MNEMNSKSLGLIETYGYTPAVEAADVCIKTANVDLIGISLVGGGLVTIKICGEVSAVKVSIQAGVAAANKVGKVISMDVIARLGSGLEKIIYSDEGDINTNNHRLDMEKQEDKCLACDLMEKSTSLEACQKEIEEKDEVSTIEHKNGDFHVKKIDFNGKILTADDARLLSDIKVVDLRKIARQIQESPIERTRIKYAKKQELVKTIKNYLKNKGD